MKVARSVLRGGRNWKESPLPDNLTFAESKEHTSRGSAAKRVKFRHNET